MPGNRVRVKTCPRDVAAGARQVLDTDETQPTQQKRMNFMSLALLRPAAATPTSTSMIMRRIRRQLLSWIRQGNAIQDLACVLRL